MAQKYLFILSAPYSGSTVLWRLLQTSRQVAALPDEGQKLPELEAMMRKEPWDPERQFDWALIRSVWERYWDLSRPVLLEKSPPHLCRAETLAREFEPAWFILLLRNPLAVCEALHRRNGLGYTEAAERWLSWLRLLTHCRARLARQTLVHYEAMTEAPGEVFRHLADWLPELSDVDPTAAVRAHSVEGVLERPLVNLNTLKLDRVAPGEREEVLAVLAREPDLVGSTPYAAILAGAG
jgi:hypothetical protein